MKIAHIILLLLFTWCRISLYAQNYVANPSFERLTSCPDDFYQIYKSPPWFSPSCEPLRPDRHGYAILFTSITPCFSDLTGVPKNVWCYQDAHTGFSYAGIEVVSARVQLSTYRQYLETKLQQPLEAGKKYYFSMFYNLCYGQDVTPDIICFNTDSLGAYFSENIIDKNPNCNALPLSPQVYDAPKKVSPSHNWQELTGCVTAKGNEVYLTIGNFAGNTFSNCAAVDSIGYYLFVDDVTVIPETARQFDTVICAGNKWTVNAQTFRQEYVDLSGWKYEWSDGSNEMEKTFSAPGVYTLKVINKDCFTDVYNFNIGFGNCTCKEYIPASFTPNGDRLNDVFIPHIVCEARQISGYAFSIYNRWGKQLFYTTSESQAWNGSYKGVAVPAGEYVYMVQYRNGAAQKVKTVKGTVLVLR